MDWLGRSRCFGWGRCSRETTRGLELCPSTCPAEHELDGRGGGDRQEYVDAFDQKARPGLEVGATVEHGLQLVGHHETTFELISFADVDVTLDGDDLDDADMYRSDRVRVIVQDADAVNLVL